MVGLGQKQRREERQKVDSALLRWPLRPTHPTLKCLHDSNGSLTLHWKLKGDAMVESAISPRGHSFETLVLI